MNQLRQVAAKERHGPILWWFFLLIMTNLALLCMVHQHSRQRAVVYGIFLSVAWLAPLALLRARAAPRRAGQPAPEPGEDTFVAWHRYARALGRVLMYYEEIRERPPEISRKLYEARADLRDTLRAHPLRDDLERVCQRIREGAIVPTQAWFAQKFDPEIRALANEYEQAAAAQMGEDRRLLALQRAVENAAALMSRRCMPRMLESERLQCATNCAWLAAQSAAVHAGQISPVDLAEMLVIEWSDFSQPWQPAQALDRALQRLAQATSAPVVPATAEVLAASPVDATTRQGTIVYRGGKRYRRVRVHRQRARRRRYRPGAQIAAIFLSFAQWIRYSLRAWMLYR